MTKREMIIKELNSRGYEASARNVNKNGVIFKGIEIKQSAHVGAVVYPENFDYGNGINDVVEKIIRTFQSAPKLQFDVSKLTDKNFVLDNICIGLQKASEEDWVKEDSEFEWIEKYLFIRITNEDGVLSSMKLREPMLDAIPCTKAELWEQAYKNTCANSEIVSMSEILGLPMMGVDDLFVVSNKERTYGASAILNKKAVKEFGKKLGVTKLVMLPSSIHECLITIYDEKSSIEELSQIVSEVNRCEVREEEVLSNQAYLIDLTEE